MTFFSCSVCKEKDMRIAELKEQVAYFKSVLNPPPRVNKFELQEDVLLDGAVKEEISVDEHAEALEAEQLRREADLIFSGNTETEN